MMQRWVEGKVMITIYKNRKNIPIEKEYVELNDVYFNKNTVMKLDEKANDIIERVDYEDMKEWRNNDE